MKKILLAPNPTGTGHNMRLLAIGRKLKHINNNLEITVLLGSRQDIFSQLFESEGIRVIDLNPTGIIDHSKNSHLESDLNWETMISNYFVPTFFNGDKVLKYMNLINELSPDLLISDYNINATIAAITSSTKNVFITERHNFTLVDVEIEDLIIGGFNVNIKEINAAKKNLQRLFDWLIMNSDLVITDKVLLASFKTDVQLLKYKSKVHFVGAMYSERSQGVQLDYGELQIDKSKPYIVGTVSSTTMLKQDKEKNISVYISTFNELKKTIPDLQLVLLGTSDKKQKNDDVIYIPYLPSWRQLIENSLLVISHPGWITVTEVSYLNIPTVFYLPNFMEYHEVEAYRRLEQLGLPVFNGEDSKSFCELIISIMKSDKEKTFSGYKILSPDKNGINKATNLINTLVEEGEPTL
ncbi:glycosyltransferase [Enterococcus plantarum]|uniref:glycosyltransferase n=1 Tax=Enterococcus plantarum TaxID=1077675 RepID=UPI001A8E36C8|nr:glycosyltransferase [Enterococcus plantarum]MBO0422308.1 hypothetical protein [Enterococcus plantarum]